MSTDQQQSSYRQIFKATGLFGGVQVITILIGLVRTKFVAVLLGTTGVGILGMYNATLGLIGTATGLGLSYSAIRDISEAAGTGDERRIARTIISFRRWVLITGVLGIFITISLSPWLSIWTFGNKNYTWSFVWLSVTLLLNAVSNGQRALLQGMRKLQSMAKATVLGSFLGLVTSVPLYYFYGIKGIVPALIITAVVSLLLSWYFARQVPVADIKISLQDSFFEGKNMIKLGVLLSISSQIGALVTYLLISFISRTGGTDQVGLYSAGTGLINTSIGLVFMAMATDYYPKLAAINKDNRSIRIMVNQQAVISVLLLLPIVLGLLIAMPLVIKIFLSKSFVEVIPFVNLMFVGVILKGISWSIGYISFAKGDSKVYFWMEGIMSNLLNLALSLIFYKLFGLIGIGIAFVALYLIYLGVVYLVARERYAFSFDRELLIVLLISLLLSCLAYFSVTFLSGSSMYLLLCVVFISGLLYSYFEINKRLDLKAIVLRNLEKYLKRK